MTNRLLSAGHLVACGLAAAPWLNPFTLGPTATVVPWLVSMAAVLTLWSLALARGARVQWPLAAVGLAVAAWAFVTHPSTGPQAMALAGGLLVITLAASAVHDAEIGRAVRSGLLVAATLSALFGLCQYFGFAAKLGPIVSLADAGEAYANLRQPNQYASLCWLGVAVLLWGSPRIGRAWVYALTALLAAASAASVSRTGLLQGLCLTGLALVWAGPGRRERLQLCATAALAYLAAAFALPVALEALAGAVPQRTLWGRLGGGDGCGSRLVLWSNVRDLIALRPWAGWGWGELDYAHFVTLYRGNRFCDILDNAHALPLHLAVELGIPAALAVCGAAVWWVLRRRPWSERNDELRLAWALLAVVLLHSLLEYPLWYGPFQLVFGASLGWLLARRAAVRGVNVPAAAVAAGLFVTAGHVAWDYLRVSQIYLAPDKRRAAWQQDPLSHAQGSWLFADQVRFAELTLAPLTQANAAWMHERSAQMLHYSPEPRVIERLIESAAMTGNTDESLLQLARYRAAFPKDYAKWQDRQRRGAAPSPQD